MLSEPVLCRLGRKGGSPYCFPFFVFVNFLCLWRTLEAVGDAAPAILGRVLRSRSATSGWACGGSECRIFRHVSRAWLRAAPLRTTREQWRMKQKKKKKCLAMCSKFRCATRRGIKRSRSMKSPVRSMVRGSWNLAAVQYVPSLRRKKKKKVTPTVIQRRRSPGCSSSACRRATRSRMFPIPWRLYIWTGDGCSFSWLTHSFLSDLSAPDFPSPHAVITHFSVLLHRLVGG